MSILSPFVLVILIFVLVVKTVFLFRFFGFCFGLNVLSLCLPLFFLGMEAEHK